MGDSSTPASTVDANMMKAEDFARVSAIDFVSAFETNINQLMEILGLTRKIEKQPGTVVKTYKVTGELEDGEVAEGETIPLSKYETEVDDIFEMTLLKWRKQTTLEAINDKGYEQAVEDTDAAMLRDIQNGVRADFFEFVQDGTGEASGVGLQGTLANLWAENQILWEDTSTSGYIYIMNPKDAAAYLGKQEVTVQTVFGMNYIESFLGLYDVLMYSGIPEGTVVTTAKQNIILYFVNPKNGEIAKAFEFITDQTGLVGVHRDVKYENLTTETVMLSGVKLFAEIMDGIILGTIEEEAAEDASGAGDADQAQG